MHYTCKAADRFRLKLVDCENIRVEVELDHEEKIVIAAIYEHPNKGISQFQEKLESTFHSLNSNNKKYYICGDMNIDLLQCGNKTSCKNYSDMLFSMRCVPTIKAGLLLLEK